MTDPSTNLSIREYVTRAMAFKKALPEDMRQEFATLQEAAGAMGFSAGGNHMLALALGFNREEGDDG